MSEETTQGSGAKGAQEPASESAEQRAGLIGDSSGDARLSATVAAAVAAAVEAMQSQSQPKVTPVTGRQPWDTLSEFIDRLFDLLGKSVIYLLVILLLGVGWYFLEQQQADKEKFFTKQLRELEKERNEAFDLVKGAYKDITDVAAKQIDNLDDSLELLTTITKEVDNTQKAGFAEKLDAYKTKQELEQALRDMKRAEMEIRKKESTAQEAEQQAEAIRREKEEAIEKARAKLEEEKKKLENQKANLIQRAGKIGELKQALRTLSDSTENDLIDIFAKLFDVGADLRKSVKRLEISLEPGSSRDVASVARDELSILSEAEKKLSNIEIYQYSAWNLTQNEMRDHIIDPSEVLTPFAGLDSTLDAEALDRLVGVSEKKFVASIEQYDGFGFDFWARVVPDDPDDIRTALVGALEGKDPTGLIRIVFLVIGEGAGAQANDKRISETKAFLGLAPALMPDKNDWLNTGVLFAIIEPSGEIEVEYESDGRPETDETISLSTLFKEMILEDVIWGMPQPFKLLQRDQFRALVRDQRLPRVVRTKLHDRYAAPRLNFDMLARAEDPDSILSDAGLTVIGDPDLRVALDLLVRSVIAKDLAAVERALGGFKFSPNEVVSKLGAFVLRPQFRVADVSIGELRVAQQQIQQQIRHQESAPADAQPGQGLEPQPLDRRARITLAVAKSADGEEDRLTLELEHSSTDDTWRLIDAVNVVP